MPKSLDRTKLADLILEHAREYAVVTFDSGGIVTSWSARAERVFGYLEEEMVDATFDITLTMSDQAADAPQRERDTARRECCAENSRWANDNSSPKFAL